MIKVIARQGIQVPVEGRPDRYITDKEAVNVPETAYWQRRLREGDLLPYAEPAATEAADAKPSDKTADKPAAPAAKADK